MLRINCLSVNAAVAFVFDTPISIFTLPELNALLELQSVGDFIIGRWQPCSQLILKLTFDLA